MKKLHASFSLALSILLMLCGCSDRPGLMPPSGGRLFEVLVVGDDSSIVRDVLQQDVPGLPQSEPQFDVSAVAADNFKSTLRLSRCIVIVSVNPKAFDVPGHLSHCSATASRPSLPGCCSPSTRRR